MSQQIDTLFTGGSVFRPGVGQLGPGSGRGGRGPDRGRRARCRARGAGRTGHRRRRPRGRSAASRLPGRARPPGDGRPGHAASASCTARRPPRSASTSSPTYAAEHPDLEWIVGGGWSMEFFPGGTPTRQALDAVVPDRPVYLTNRDGHGTWVNTLALELAGVDAGTPDPQDGRIERDADGNPDRRPARGSGSLVGRLLPDTSDDDMYAGLLAAQDLLFSLGITAWQDAAVGRLFGLDDIYPIYLSAARSGDLKARVVGALWWERERGAEQIPELVGPPDRGPGGALRGHQRQDHAGRCRRELHGRDARALPRPRRLRHAQRRAELRRPGRPARPRDPARRGRLPGPLPRARGPGRPRGARRHRGGARRQRPDRRPPPPRPPAGRAPRRRTAVRASWGRSPTSSRCGPPTNRRWTS